MPELPSGPGPGESETPRQPMSAEDLSGGLPLPVDTAQATEGELIRGKIYRDHKARLRASEAASEATQRLGALLDDPALASNSGEVGTAKRPRAAELLFKGKEALANVGQKTRATMEVNRAQDVQDREREGERAELYKNYEAQQRAQEAAMAARKRLAELLGNPEAPTPELDPPIEPKRPGVSELVSRGKEALGGARASFRESYAKNQAQDVLDREREAERDKLSTDYEALQKAQQDATKARERLASILDDPATAAHGDAAEAAANGPLDRFDGLSDEEITRRNEEVDRYTKLLERTPSTNGVGMITIDNPEDPDLLEDLDDKYHFVRTETIDDRSKRSGPGSRERTKMWDHEDRILGTTRNIAAAPVRAVKLDLESFGFLRDSLTTLDPIDAPVTQDEIREYWASRDGKVVMEKVWHQQRALYDKTHKGKTGSMHLATVRLIRVDEGAYDPDDIVKKRADPGLPMKGRRKKDFNKFAGRPRTHIEPPEDYKKIPPVGEFVPLPGPVPRFIEPNPAPAGTRFDAQERHDLHHAAHLHGFDEQPPTRAEQELADFRPPARETLVQKFTSAQLKADAEGGESTEQLAAMVAYRDQVALDNAKELRRKHEENELAEAAGSPPVHTDITPEQLAARKEERLETRRRERLGVNLQIEKENAVRFAAGKEPEPLVADDLSADELEARLQASVDEAAQRAADGLPPLPPNNLAKRLAVRKSLDEQRSAATLKAEAAGRPQEKQPPLKELPGWSELDEELAESQAEDVYAEHFKKEIADKRSDMLDDAYAEELETIRALQADWVEKTARAKIAGTAASVPAESPAWTALKNFMAKAAKDDQTFVVAPNQPLGYSAKADSPFAAVLESIMDQVDEYGLENSGQPLEKIEKIHQARDTLILRNDTKRFSDLFANPPTDEEWDDHQQKYQDALLIAEEHGLLRIDPKQSSGIAATSDPRSATLVEFITSHREALLKPEERKASAERARLEALSKRFNDGLKGILDLTPKDEAGWAAQVDALKENKRAALESGFVLQDEASPIGVKAGLDPASERYVQLLQKHPDVLLTLAERGEKAAEVKIAAAAKRYTDQMRILFAAVPQDDLQKATKMQLFYDNLDAAKKEGLIRTNKAGDIEPVDNDLSREFVAYIEANREKLDIPSVPRAERTPVPDPEVVETAPDMAKSMPEGEYSINRGEGLRAGEVTGFSKLVERQMARDATFGLPKTGQMTEAQVEKLIAAAETANDLAALELEIQLRAVKSREDENRLSGATPVDVNVKKPDEARMLRKVQIEYRRMAGEERRARRGTRGQTGQTSQPAGPDAPQT